MDISKNLKSDHMATVKTLKTAVRKEIAEIIKNISTDEKQRQSAKVTEKLFALPQYRSSRRVSIYLSTPDEVDTLPIIKDLFKNNKEVFVPRYKGKIMEMVKLISMDDYEQLPLTKWNIKQPDFKDIRDNALETGGLDLILLPGVGFTKNGKRLGHGMGYYDRFLETCFKQQKTKPYLIALSLNEQVKDDIPITEKDVPFDLLLTEN